MTIRAIDIGNVPNDGTGDDLREAFVKVNENFSELDSRTGPNLFTIESLPGGGESIYAGESNNLFQFKTINAGSNISLRSDSNSVSIDASGGIDGILIVTDDGSVVLDDSTTFYFQGSPSSLVKTRVEPNPTSGSTVFFELNNAGIVEYDTRPSLSHSLDADYNNINNVDTVSAAILKGNLEGTVYNIDIRDLNNYFENYWNFSSIYPDDFKNILDYLNFAFDVNMGSISEPAQFSIDAGEITQ